MISGGRQIRSPSVTRALDRRVRMRPAHAWMIVLLALDLTAIGDLVSGTDLWLGPLYLLAICLGTWSLGWFVGEGLLLACMVLTFTINGGALYPYDAMAVAGNAAMRFLAGSMVITMIAGARRAYLRVWWLARTDALTGALNRQAFFELGSVLAGTCCWRVLLYADLDGLKAINDGEGHAAGDACLKSYAAEVRRIIRRDDMFARVGGDEFLLFMAVKDEASAKSVAARLHGSMNAIRVAGGRHLRCSVGTIVVPPGRLSIDELVRRADNLMYQAKLRGASLELAVASDVKAGSVAGRARQLARLPATASQTRKGPAERRAS
jgi:diguanylate cyclase (GGDEF)-like protein